MSFASRLRKIEKQLSPEGAVRKRKPKEPHECLQQLKAMLAMNTQAEWILNSNDFGLTLSVVPKEFRNVQSVSRMDKPFVMVEWYNLGWPVTVHLMTPEIANTGLQVLGAAMVFKETNLIARDAKALEQILADHLESPAILDWLKVQA